jgi:signal transduction histidine kinase
LEREIGRREAVQKALDKSEQRYRQLLERSRQVEDHLRRLSHEILSAQEDERKRISRELHDEVGQTLTAINVKLAALRNEAEVSTAGLSKRIATTQRLVEQSMDTVHRFARELRPPVLDDLGLLPALRACMKDFTKRTRVPIHATTMTAVESLGLDKRTVLYRVAQEALSNVAKHARATLVEVSLIKLDGHVCMEIHDNGKSFQAQRALFTKKIKRLGLLGMRERVEMVGGAFAVESSPGKGTTIRAQIPLRNGQRESARARARAAR